MSQIYLFQDPDQQSVLLAGLREWLPDDDLAYFISEVVEQMDPRFREGRLCRTSPPALDGEHKAALQPAVQGLPSQAGIDSSNWTLRQAQEEGGAPE